MSIIGQPRHFHTKFKFQIEIDGLGSAAFQSCSELKAEIAKIEYFEGGAITPDKQPGRLTISDITLERAVTKDVDLYTWFQMTANAVVNGGLRSPMFKRQGSIVQYDRDNAVMRRWQLAGLWPVSYVGGAWDNNSDEFAMEQIVLSLDWFLLKKNNR